MASTMSVRRAIGEAGHQNTRSAEALNLRAQNRVQAPPGHDVGFASKDSGGRLFHVHQCEKPERALGMVKEQVDIRVFACLTSHRRAEQVEMLDAQPLQLGFMLLELRDRFAAFHRSSLAEQHTE